MWDLVPGPGIEPGPPALGERGLSNWTTGEVPSLWQDTQSSSSTGCRCTPAPNPVSSEDRQPSSDIWLQLSQFLRQTYVSEAGVGEAEG